MHALDDEGRRRLLDHYLAYEPTIEVNDIAYHVHYFDQPDDLLFIALRLRMWQIDGAVKVPRAFYDTINNGLAMAWLTMTVFDGLAESVQSRNVRLSLQDLRGDIFQGRDD
jgi:hypothetical protein